MLALRDREALGADCGRAVAVPLAPHRALDLDRHVARRRRQNPRESEQVLSARVGPEPVGLVALARLVPALREVVVHVGRRGPAHLDVHVVGAAELARGVAGRDHRGVVQVDAAHEGDLAGLARVDEPALLVLAVAAVGLVPAREEARAAPGAGTRGPPPSPRSASRESKAASWTWRQKITRTSTPRACARSSTSKKLPWPSGMAKVISWKATVTHTLRRAFATASQIRPKAGPPSTSGRTALPARIG